MRRLADAERLRSFLKQLAHAADTDATVYLTGGATAVLVGWRESTLAADILILPESDARLRELFEDVAARLHRYPAVDPKSFRKRLDEALLPRDATTNGSNRTG